MSTALIRKARVAARILIAIHPPGIDPVRAPRDSRLVQYEPSALGHPRPLRDHQCSCRSFAALGQPVGVGLACRPDCASASEHASETTGNAYDRAGGSTPLGVSLWIIYTTPGAGAPLADPSNDRNRRES